jgi:hypothetical protein
MRIDHLADHLELVGELVALHFAQWGHLHPDETMEGRTRRLESCAGRGGVPTVFVALQDAELLGSAMLIANDMDPRPDQTPWLYTPDAEAFYQRLGWTLDERCGYLGHDVAIMSKAPP